MFRAGYSIGSQAVRFTANNTGRRRQQLEQLEHVAANSSSAPTSHIEPLTPSMLSRLSQACNTRKIHVATATTTSLGSVPHHVYSIRPPQRVTSTPTSVSTPLRPSTRRRHHSTSTSTSASPRPFSSRLISPLCVTHFSQLRRDVHGPGRPTPQKTFTHPPAAGSTVRTRQSPASAATTSKPAYDTKYGPNYLTHPPTTPVVVEPGSMAAREVATGTGGALADEVLANQGLSNFLGRVYSTTGLSVAGTLFGSYALASLGLVAASGPMFLASIVGTFGSLFYLIRTQPKTVVQASKKHMGQGSSAAQSAGELVSVNPPGRQAAFMTFVASNALLLSPVVGLAHMLHPLIVPAAAGAAGLVMGGASLFAYRRPAGSLLSLQAPLAGALLSVILLNVGGMAAAWAWGPNLFSSLMYTTYPYVTIGLFSVFTAVDTHAAVQEYKSGKADHLGHAVGFYLNFLNLFQSFIRIFSDMFTSNE